MSLLPVVKLCPPSQSLGTGPVWAHAMIHKHTMHTGITGKPWVNGDIHIRKANMIGRVS